MTVTRWFRTTLAGLAVLAGALLALGWALDRSRAGPPVDVALPALAVPADGPLRIVVLGTSLGHRALWPEAVGQALSDCLGRPVGIGRLTLPGASSDWGLTQVDAVAAQAPDLVTVEFAINDADLWDGLSLQESRANLARMVAEFGGRGVAVLLVGTGPVGRVAAMKRPFLPVFQDIYPELAREEGTGFFDAERRWRALPGWRTALADGVHPDPATEAEVVVAPMARMIGRAFGADCRGRAVLSPG